MLGSQEKILEPKVNVKFFMVDPYTLCNRIPRRVAEFHATGFSEFLDILSLDFWKGIIHLGGSCSKHKLKFR